MLDCIWKYQSSMKHLINSSDQMSNFDFIDCWLDGLRKLSCRSYITLMTIACTAGGILIFFIVTAAGVPVVSRGFDKLDLPTLIVDGVVLAPLLETLVFQLLPAYVLTRKGCSQHKIFIFCFLPFALAHAVDGWAIFIGAGVACGFVLGLTMIVWDDESLIFRALAVYIIHAAHNGILLAIDEIMKRM